MKPMPPDTVHCREPTLTPDCACAGAMVDRAVRVVAPRRAKKARRMVRSLSPMIGALTLSHPSAQIGESPEAFKVPLESPGSRRSVQGQELPHQCDGFAILAWEQ